VHSNEYSAATRRLRLTRSNRAPYLRNISVAIRSVTWLLGGLGATVDARRPTVRSILLAALGIAPALFQVPFVNAERLTGRVIRIAHGDRSAIFDAGEAQHKVFVADIDAAKGGRSAGCGKAEAGTGNFVRQNIRVLGRARTYYLRVPRTYEPNRAYPLIFRWHGSGGNGLSGGLAIEFSSRNDAIVVGADGLSGEWGRDTANLPFFDRMLDTLEKRYCIDRGRVFSYGFSTGGSFTNLLACERGDILRASASIAGGPRGNTCVGKVASWFLHDVDDNVVPIAAGRAARDRALAINGCSTTTVDEGEGCVRYRGCEAAPIVWCESRGFGHNVRGDFAPALIWKFFQKLH